MLFSLSRSRMATKKNVHQEKLFQLNTTEHVGKGNYLVVGSSVTHEIATNWVDIKIS